MLIDPAELAGNRIEAQTLKRVGEIYNGALQKITDECNSFLRKIKDIDEGRIKPPAYYDTPEKVLAWRRGFTRELLRKENVAKRIEAVLNAAGVETAPIIRESIAAIYKVNREYALEMLGDKVRSVGVNVEFSMFDKRQIDVLLKDSQPAFSKIAYRSLGSNPAIVHRLQNELAQATILGEGQPKIIKRIRDVTGQSLYQAKRVAQTERTRVQSQGRAEALHEAAKAGVKVTKEWSARMVNTRESHAMLDGKKIKENEKFKTVWGNELAYPGDPSAPAEETINCHCVLIPGVDLPKASNDGKSGRVLDRPFSNGKMEVGDTFTHAGKTVVFQSWEGTAETIAGKGCKKKIDGILGLVDEHGGRPKEWKKKKRWANVDVDGVSGRSDFHWCEEPNAGYAWGKVKDDDETGQWFYPDR